MDASAGRDLNLDEGVLMHLMSFLDAPSLCAASMTCRSWKQLADDDYLWQPLHSQCSNPMLNRQEVGSSSPLACQGSLYGGASEGIPFSAPVVPAACSSGTGMGLSFKDSFALGQNWRRGKAQRVVAKFPGSNWNSAARLNPDGCHAVLASAGAGSVAVVDIATGERCPSYAGISPQHMEVDDSEAGDALDALYSSVAISPSCGEVAFGGFDGIVSLYDVRRGSLLASATLPGQQPAVTALGFCCIQSTRVIGAGLADGCVALSPLQAWNVCPGPPACSLPFQACRLAGCPAHLGPTQVREVTGPWLVCNLGQGVEVRRIKGECGPGAGLSIVAGTSGGHVKVVDGAMGRVRSSLVGSCSCPVKCLSLHSNATGPSIPEPGRPGPGFTVGARRAAQAAPQALSRVVYAGFDHNTVGNGHYNAIYVWDAGSTERVALLHPGASGLRSSRGRRPSMSDLSGMIRSVWADGWKVAVSAGKSVTVFETRTWKPLYELSVPITAGNDTSCPFASERRASVTPLDLQSRFSLAAADRALPAGPTRRVEETVKAFVDSHDKSRMGEVGSGEGSDSALGSAEGIGSSSPSPEKRKSLSGLLNSMEQVSESPGALIFFGSTMAVGLKDGSFALVTFGGPNGGAAQDDACNHYRHPVAVKKLS